MFNNIKYNPLKDVYEVSREQLEEYIASVDVLNHVTINELVDYDELLYAYDKASEEVYLVMDSIEEVE